MRDDVAKKVEVLSIHRDFRCLPQKIITKLAFMASRKFYGRGEFVFHAGDKTDHCHFVESGCIPLSKESSSGKSIAFLLAEKGATLNAVTCFRPCTRFFSARAIEKAIVLEIPIDDFIKWVFEYPALTRNIIVTLGDLLDAAYQRILDLMNESAEQRIINILFIISARLGMTLALTNQDLADLSGTSRETAARIVSKLQASGILSKSRGKIKIQNASQLKSLSTRFNFFS